MNHLVKEESDSVKTENNNTTSNINNKENTNPNDSPLNQWFRQQGASKTIPPIHNQNKSEKFKRAEHLTSSRLPQIETNATTASFLKKRQFFNYESSYSSIPNINDSPSSDRAQTPKLSSFYLR